MKTQTGYYGETEYNPSDLIVVAEGFFGFPELKQFLPLRLDEDNDSLLLMQSVENSQVAFVVIAPTILCPDYSPVLTEEDLSALDTEDCNELSYYAVCVIKDNYLEDTVNLKCPLAINPKTKAARQVILENTAYGYRHKLNTFSSITKKTQDRSNCHADTAPENK